MLDSWSLHSPQYVTSHSLTRPRSRRPLVLNLLSPSYCRQREKQKHTDENVRVTARVSSHPIPRDSLLRHGRFREITFPNQLCPLLERGKFALKIIEGSREDNLDIAPFIPSHFSRTFTFPFAASNAATPLSVFAAVCRWCKEPSCCKRRSDTTLTGQPNGVISSVLFV